MVVRGYREGEMEMMENGYNVCFRGDLKLDSGDDCIIQFKKNKKQY